MRKLLLISNRYSVNAEPLRRAFSALGLEVRFIDYWGHPLLMPQNIIHRLADKLPKNIRERLRTMALKKIDDKIWKIANEFRPDIVFVTKGKSLDINLLDKLRTISKTANWYSETMDHWERIKNISPHYDYFFSFDPYVVERLASEGRGNAYYLPFCADLDKNAAWNPDPQYNVTFVGSFLESRYDARELILDKVKDLGLNIWGNKAWEKTKVRDNYRGWLPRYEDVAEAYRKSKIVINVHLTDVGGIGINFRPFEVAAMGSLLVNHSERKDIFNLFEAGKEFVPFDGPNDIRKIISYYLEHEEERINIARAGFERVRRYHTYLDRAQAVLNTIKL